MEEEIWLINKYCRTIFGSDTYRHASSYKKLYDALRFIGIWSNMMTKSGYAVEVDPTDESNVHEVRFVAKKDNEEELIVLQKIELKGEKEES